MTAPLRVWVVSDGRAGMENQALGLAEAVQRRVPAEIAVRRVRWRAAFDPLPVWAKRPFMLAPSPEPVGPPWPDLWIATGRASLPLSLAVRRWSGGRTFVVQTQDPRLAPDRFDLVVAPAHDGLAGPNVVSVIGGPNRITPERLAQAAARFQDRLAPLPRPRVALMIGGSSRVFGLPPQVARRIGDEARAAVEAAGGSVLATFSRRTPPEVQALIGERLAGLPGWVWDGTGDNPLFAFLHAADHILVTEDSANMLAEAATTGRPVQALALERRRAGPTKFDRLRRSLADHGALRPFDGRLESWAYPPLAETDRAAGIIVERLMARRSVPGGAVAF